MSEMSAAPTLVPTSASLSARGPVPETQFLRIDRLTKSFDGVVAVDSVSLNIPKGEIFALLGSSGCGKSTLLRMLAGFEPPTSGAIYLDGENIGALPPYQRAINMMFQSYALFPHLSVWENVAFGLQREGLPKGQIKETVEGLLEVVKLKPYAKRKPHQLSGGQQQRTALARCLAKSPKLLLLDEPLGALDRKLREETQFELQKIIKRVGVTCVLVTHDQEEAMTMADRVAIMSEGSFLQIGAPRDVYEIPNCRFVADFIGKINMFDGRLSVDEPDHCVVDTAVGQFYVGHGISGSLEMAITIAVRPEKIELQLEMPTDTPYNYLRGEIVDTGYFGSFSLYRVALSNGQKLQVQMTHSQRLGDSFERGDTVFALCAPDALVVLPH